MIELLLTKAKRNRNIWYCIYISFILDEYIFHKIICMYGYTSLIIKV